METQQETLTIDFKKAKKLLDNNTWFYDTPTGYSYFEALDNNYDIDEVINWLDCTNYGVLFLEEFYTDNRVELEDYLRTLDCSGDTVDDADYRVKLFLDYFSNLIARTKITTQNRKLSVPEWVVFTLNI